MLAAPTTTTTAPVSTAATTSAAKRSSHVGEGLLHAGHERHGNGGRRLGWLSSGLLDSRWGSTLVTVAHARGRLVAKLVSRRSRCDILRECWARRCMGSMSGDDWFHDESLRPSVLKWRVVNGHSLTAVDAVNQRRDSLCAREERAAWR